MKNKSKGGFKAIVRLPKPNRPIDQNTSYYRDLLTKEKFMKDINGWCEITPENKPSEVVLVACNTYDCGWTMDTAWWNEDDKCWMTTGSLESQKAHLPYTHWRELPKFPEN